MTLPSTMWGGRRPILCRGPYQHCQAPLPYTYSLLVFTCLSSWNTCGFFPKLLRSPHLFDNNHIGLSSRYSKQQGQHMPESESERGYSCERSRTSQQSAQLWAYHSLSPGDEIPTYENLSWDKRKQTWIKVMSFKGRKKQTKISYLEKKDN